METSVLTDGLFDLYPHLCDTEYMYSQTLSWCPLDHRGGTQQQQYSRWMRSAPRHADFSILRPVQPDPREQHGEPFDKMRFMGLSGDMLKEQPANSGLRKVIAVQQCGVMGICQTEAFTFGGIHCTRKRHVVHTVEVLPAPPPVVPAVVREDFATLSGNDMIQCGAMGYVDSSENTMYILDPLVSPLAYILEGIKQVPLVPPAVSNACQDVFYAPSTLASANGYLVDAAQGFIRYNSGRQTVREKVQDAAELVHDHTDPGYAS